MELPLPPSEARLEFLTPLILLYFRSGSSAPLQEELKLSTAKPCGVVFRVGADTHKRKEKKNKNKTNLKVEPGKAKTKNQKQNNFNFQNFFKTFQLKIWTQSHTEQKNVSSKLKISFLNTPYRLQCFALIPANTLNLPK